MDSIKSGNLAEPELREEAIVATHGLTKRYGSDAPAVDELSLTVRRGEVYGFLGPNGAGKSTTLMMLLGLIGPSSGSVEIFGESPGHPAAAANTGALVETPAFYPYLSGRDNLLGVAQLVGMDAPKDRVGEILDSVGLREKAKVRFKKYSLGMKQRLGIAAALLKDPELLVLDEPTNGMDPRGMNEIRELVCSLGQQGKTVLLSSHLLAEVEQTCDRVGIVQRGRLVAEGSVEELGGDGGLLLQADPLEEAASIAAMYVGEGRVRIEEGWIRLGVDPGRAPELGNELIAAGIRVSEMRAARRSLEEVFLKVTEEVDGEDRTV